MSKSKSKATRRKARATGVAKSGPVWHQTAEEATLAQMPRYNAHACGTGPHGDAKYNRARQKRDWQRELNREGTRNRGFLLFVALKRVLWLRQTAAIKESLIAAFH